jgi:hypothetical protein
MFASEKNGSVVWVISNGMRFSRRTAFTKRLIAVEVFRPTLEQKVSKPALSFSSTLAVKVASAIGISPFVFEL